MNPSPLALAILVWLAAGPIQAASPGGRVGTVALQPCRPAGVTETLRCGAVRVPENRARHGGRILTLPIVVIPARMPHPARGPVFYLAGGPGETVTELAPDLLASPSRQDSDIVLVDERGTGGDNRLNCPSLGSADNPAGYLRDPFDPAAARECAATLARTFDLSQYTTAAYADDIDAVRRAMGYARINLEAGSFGTYAAQVYMLRYPRRVRTAWLASIVAPANTVPLNHARAAQGAIDTLFTRCARNPACATAFPALPDRFRAVLRRLSSKPVEVRVDGGVVALSERGFADAVRVMLYAPERAGRLPLLIDQATRGDFRPFAEQAVRANRGIYEGVRLGLHYAVTCNEFVRRIDPAAVPAATAGSFFGAWRVRSQIAACREWPATAPPRLDFSRFPNVPMVLVTGDTDPVTPVRWAEWLKARARRAVSLIVPGGGHVPDDACLGTVRQQLLRTGRSERLDTTCLAAVQPLPFALPADR